MRSRTNVATHAFPCGSRLGWWPPSPGQSGQADHPGRLQLINEGGNHRCVRAATSPDGKAINLNLDTPEVRLGLASLGIAFRGYRRCVDHRRYKLRFVIRRCLQLARLPPPSEHVLRRQPVSSGNVGSDRA
jgi:hypothetical protein